ncbi:MAG: histidine kinase [Candidatus Acidiferrales bacterium]
MTLPSLRVIARAYLMSIVFWFGISFLMGWQYGVLDRQHLWPSFVNLFGMAAVRGFALALWTPPIFYLVGKYLRYSSHRVTYVLVCILGAIPFVLLHSAIQWLLIPQVDDTTHAYIARSMQSWLDIVRGAFADQIFIYIAIVVAAHAYEYLKRLRSEEREKYEYQQALAASELQALKMQLHPHFLFNTLHGIATVVDGDSNGKAMIIKLANLLRRALERDSVDLVPLEDELRFVTDYIDLEQMRFGTRLKVDWQLGPGTSSLLVPQMVLQLLVENAIRHGISTARQGGWVSVAVNQNEGVLELSVRNSVGKSASNGNGVGLRNTEARLKYLYAGEANLRFAISEDRIATVTVRLPVLNSQPARAEVRQGHPVGLEAL